MIQEEIIKGMEGFVEDQLYLLKPVENCWQPIDLLPQMNDKHWLEELQEFRKSALTLSDEVLVVLVGNMITEEALPSYETWLNGLSGIKDITGRSPSPWARWTRGWTAEENRHGELLNAYLYLSARVDMRSIEITVQYLIKNGFDPETENDPYMGLVYTSIQERATKIAHNNTGELAEKSGDRKLSKICALIAGDEARHEEAYKRFFGKIIELDPSMALLAFAKMMKKRVIMPARLMSDGSDLDLFTMHVLAAQRIGVYTTRDYAEVVDHLVNYWKIPYLSTLTAEASKAQEYLCGLSKHYLNTAERMERSVARKPKKPCPWIFGRSI